MVEVGWRREGRRTEAMAAETAAVFVSATARRLEGRVVKRTSSMERLGGDALVCLSSL